MDRRDFIASIAGMVAMQATTRTDAAKRETKLLIEQRLQNVIDGYVNAGKLSGAVAALSIGESRLIVRAGRIALDQRRPFDEDSICRIYSMTKPVTGCAAMLLIQDGKLSLDQPVASVLPELSKLSVAVDPRTGLDARPATQALTIRHLLTHSGGLAYWTPEAGTDALSKAYRSAGITPGNYYASGRSRPGFGPQADGLDEMVRRLAELPLASEPGTAWRYSVGLDVMGLVIERVSGSPLDTFARERLFVPLGMNSTGFEVQPSASARLTSNYTVTAAGLEPLDPAQSSVFLQRPKLIAGGAGLLSTARDFR